MTRRCYLATYSMTVLRLARGGRLRRRPLEAMKWPYVARKGVRRELRQDGVCPVDTTLNLAREGWVQHEKKSAALLWCVLNEL